MLPPHAFVHRPDNRRCARSRITGDVPAESRDEMKGPGGDMVVGFPDVGRRQ